MNSAKRREDKKRRREKRLAKREHRAVDTLDNLIKMLDRVAKIPPPETFPGASDPILSRPDALKFEYGQWVSEGPGKERMRRFERSVEQGLIGFFPEVDHWAMEEFLWHGAPNDAWHPIDAFLAAHGKRFSPAAQEQFKLWKQAKIGLFEIGACANDLIALRERDPLTMQPVGAWVNAIALNMAGVNDYARQKGTIALAYLAPWAPEQNIYCAMGYGMSLPESSCAMAVPLILGMRNIKAATFPLPWKVGKVARQECLEQWRRRDWYTWMKDRVRCPFQAAVALPQGIQILTIDRMMTTSPEEGAHLGLYFCASITQEDVGLLGATAITPLDLDSPNAMAFAEYTAFREVVGPPPGTRGIKNTIIPIK